MTTKRTYRTDADGGANNTMHTPPRTVTADEAKRLAAPTTNKPNDERKALEELKRREENAWRVKESK